MFKTVINVVLIFPILFLLGFIAIGLKDFKPQCVVAGADARDDCSDGLGGLGDLLAPFVLSGASSLLLILIVALVSVNKAKA